MALLWEKTTKKDDNRVLDYAISLFDRYLLWLGKLTQPLEIYGTAAVLIAQEKVGVAMDFGWVATATAILYCLIRSSSLIN